VRAQTGRGLDGAQGLDGADEGLPLAKDAVGEFGGICFLLPHRLATHHETFTCNLLGRVESHKVVPGKVPQSRTGLGTKSAERGSCQRPNRLFKARERLFVP
jgi:hypothetical protein